MITYRFNKIKTSADFIIDNDGLEVLDSISMRLQFIGESLKKVEKLNKKILEKYPETDWNKIINLRDFISHHYDMLNHEIIFDICCNHIPALKNKIIEMLCDFVNVI